jgi:hypothetical protein
VTCEAKSGNWHKEKKVGEKRKWARKESGKESGREKKAGEKRKRARKWAL